MERENDLIDLGAATEETKGFPGVGPDVKLGQAIPGIADD